MLRKIVGFELVGDEFVVKDVDNYKLFKFVHEAVVDNHIPVYKPIGFYLNTPLNISVTTVTDRNVYCMENMFTLANNLDFVVFNNENDIMIMHSTRDVVTTKSYWKSNGKPVVIKGDEQVVYTPCDLTGMTVRLLRSSGYADMRVTSKIIGNNKFFPMCTVFSISPFIRILPYQGKVRMKLLGDFTSDNLRDLLLRWLSDYTSGNLRLEEKEWLSEYMEC